MVIAGLWINIIGVMLLLLFATSVNQRRDKRHDHSFTKVLFGCGLLTLIIGLI